MNLPSSCTIEVEENDGIKDATKRAREWCGSIVGAMVWLSTIIPSTGYVFRGLADAAWNLESSLFRSVKPGTLKDLLKAEGDMLKQVAADFWFRREFGFSPARTPAAGQYDRTVAVLQHHGVPTRLLDVTLDPLVGLYFTVIGTSVVGDMDSVDGAVLFIRDVPPSVGLPFHIVRAPQVSERITAQRAAFVAPAAGAAAGVKSAETVAFDFYNIGVTNGSLTNFDNLVDNYLTGSFSGRPPSKAPNFLMIRVPGSLKPACRGVLRSMGVSARTLFPGSEGYRKDLAGF